MKKRRVLVCIIFLFLTVALVSVMLYKKKRGAVTEKTKRKAQQLRKTTEKRRVRCPTRFEVLSFVIACITMLLTLIQVITQLMK